jgi:hypothetical protein
MVCNAQKADVSETSCDQVFGIPNVGQSAEPGDSETE